MVSILLPTILGAVLYRKQPNTIKTLSVMVFILCAFEFSSYFLSLYSISNLFLFHSYAFVEFILISLIYYHIFKSPTLKRLISIFVIVFLSISVVSLILLESWKEFNSIQRSIESFLLVVYFVIHLRKMIVQKKSPFVEMHPYFILTSGFLIYFLGTSFVFFFANEFIGTSDLSYWTIHSLLNILLNIVYSIVLWKASEASDYL